MKAYILKEEDFERLLNRLELAMHQKSHDKTEEQSIKDMHRWFNYVVVGWVNEVQK